VKLPFFGQNLGKRWKNLYRCFSESGFKENKLSSRALANRDPPPPAVNVAKLGG